MYKVQIKHFLKLKSMTLFVSTPRRRVEISDVYVMGLTFLLFFAIGKILKEVVIRHAEKKNNPTIVANPRGGGIEFELSDDTELGLTILSCIADNEQYLVKDPELIKIIFRLAKAKIKKKSLVLTPNMARFLALQLINNDQTFIVKIGNAVLSSNNRVRLFARVTGAAMVGLIGSIMSMLPYAILITLLLFDSTKECGYPCKDYFEQLPQEGPVRIYGETATGQLAIAGNDDARQVEVYTPTPSTECKSTSISDSNSRKVTRSYTKSPKKARQVNFLDFKKTDPVLSAFKDLEEPDVPQGYCPFSSDEIIATSE